MNSVNLCEEQPSPPQSPRASSPHISVLLTVYNRTNYLSEALDSVLAQTYNNYEILVVDDSGCAVARDIISRYADADRISYVANPTTFGIAVSISRAVKKARGMYIAILNDDDLWEPTLLAELVAPLESDTKRVLAFADHWLMDAAGRLDYELSDQWSAAFARSSMPEGPIPEFAEFSVLSHGVPIANSALFRKDAIDWALVVSRVSGSYDYWISCLLASTGRPAYYIPRRLARYRVHPSMETRRPGYDKDENLAYILTTLLERHWFPQMRQALKARLAVTLIEAGRHKLHFDDRRVALRYFSRSLMLRWRPRTLMYLTAALLPTVILVPLRSAFRFIRHRPV